MDRFQNKYRIPSARASWWNYRNAGAYFITICTRNREKCFGEITDGEMILSETGIIVDTMWHEIKNHAPNIETDAFVVMPNHIHGIIILNHNHIGTFNIETLHATSLQKPLPPRSNNDFMAAISPKSASVSTTIRSYKSAVTKQTHRLEYTFEWQPRFHDHIIRDEAVSL